MKPKFECLYFLDNTAVFIIEIKRIDLADDEDPAAIYEWMMIDKLTLNVSPLTFRAMDSSAQVEERFFEEGYLKFNEDVGTFIEKFNSAQHQLINRKGIALTDSLQNSIENYLIVKPVAH